MNKRRQFLFSAGVLLVFPLAAIAQRNVPHLYRQAAAYVDRILKGARPADLPTSPPAKLDFTINRQTAKSLGLNIPQALLDRADGVVG